VKCGWRQNDKVDAKNIKVDASKIFVLNDRLRHQIIDAEVEVG
jgi:hypothetical protein